MVLESRRIDCTKCGAPLTLRSERSKTAACDHCRALIDLTSADYAFIGAMHLGPIRHPLRVGQSGTLRGVPCTIVGHLRYTEETWFWDAYIQYDDGAFTLYVPFVPTDPKPVSSTSDVLAADGRRDPVSERGRAVLSLVEGELTWRARIGDSIDYLEGSRFCVEIGAAEFEWFTMEVLPRAVVARAFGVDSVEFDRGCYVIDEDEDEDEDEEPRASAGAHEGTIFNIAILLLFGLFFGMATCDPNDDDGLDDVYGGGHYHSSGYSGGK